MNDLIMEERYEDNPNVQTKTKKKLQKMNKKSWKQNMKNLHVQRNFWKTHHYFFD
jgi:hypothetical protein